MTWIDVVMWAALALFGGFVAGFKLGLSILSSAEYMEVRQEGYRAGYIAGRALGREEP